MAKKTWFYLCMLGCLLLTLNACQFITDYEKAKPAINKELDNIEILSTKLQDAYKEHKAGELTTEELQGLTMEIRDSIGKSKDAIVALEQESVGWGSMIMATAMGLLSRGIPSKGPLAMVFNLFMTRRKEE
jgi:hypothetical protein